MIKKITLIIASLTFCACAINPQSIDPSINPEERHIWLPADEGELEKRRLRQTHFDGIAKEIETLFLNLETTVPRETDIREGINDFISEIGSLESNRTDQITNEKKRIDTLAHELKEVRLSNKQINNQVVNMHLAPVFTKEEYVNAFYYFRKGKYVKSSNLFKNLLRLNPPHPLIDNILFGLSMSYFKLKKYSKAMDPLSRVIEKHAGSEKWYMSHVMLALVHEIKGEKSQALYIIEKSLKNDPPYFIRSVINNVINLVQEESIQAEN